jgi:phospholipid/cholesterol/gamma-HCH transport system substrate-binding protein
MRNSLETRLGLFFALVIVAGFVLFEMVGGAALFSKGMPVRARFTSISDLKPGDPVKLAGVKVGRVTDIRIAGGKVEVVMSLDTPGEVKTDSRASVKFTGLMGQNYVALSFGSEAAPTVAADTLLETRDQPDLASVMAKLESAADGLQNMGKSFSGEEFSKLLGPMTDLLKDNQPRIAAILGNLQNVTTTLAEGKGTLGRLMNEDTLYTTALSTVTNLSGTTEDLKVMLADTRRMVDAMNRGEGTMGKLLKDEKLYAETATAMVNLREILQKINQGQGSVGKLVNDEAFLKNLKITLQKVEKATEGLEDAGPLSVLSQAAGTIF